MLITGKECVWLMFVILHSENTCNMTLVANSPIRIYEDNATCVAQVRWEYILRNFLYIHEFQESQQVDVKQIYSPDNLVKLLTKSLPISTFEKLISLLSSDLTKCKIKIVQFKRSVWTWIHCTIFSSC